MADGTATNSGLLRHAYQAGAGITIPAQSGSRVVVHGLRVGLNDTDVTNANMVVRSGAASTGQLLDQITLASRHSVVIGNCTKQCEVYVSKVGEGLVLEDSAGTLLASVTYSYRAGGLDLPEA